MPVSENAITITLPGQSGNSQWWANDPVAGQPKVESAPQPRGIRNQNPGNIEDGPFARSLPGYAGSDGRFAKFDTMEAGQGAMDALLASYGRKGINTTEGVINRWAPAADNNPTKAYSSFVAQQAGLEPNQAIDLSDPQIRQKIAAGMARFENGQAVPQQSKNWWEADPVAQPAQSQEAKPQAPAAPQPEFKSTGDPERDAYIQKRAGELADSSGASKFVQGLTFGFGDEIGAGISSAVKGTKYDDELAAERLALSRFEKESPVAAPIAEVGGGLATLPIAPALGAAAGAGKLARFGAGLATGAGYGAVAGAGKGEDTQSRLEGAATGAGVGAALGGPLGMIGRGAATVAGPKGSEVAASAERLGVEVPRGIVSDNRGVQSLTQAARQIPYVGGKIDQRLSNAGTQLGEAISTKAGDLAGGPIDRTIAGGGIKTSIADIVTANNERMSDAYGKLRGIINSNAPQRLSNTDLALNKILNQRAMAGQRNPSAGLEDIENLVQRGAGFDGLQRARTAIGDMINFGKSNPGYNAGDLKRLYGAMTADMEAVVRSSAKPGQSQAAAQALRDANSEAAKIIKQNYTFSKITGIQSDEKVATAILNAAKDKTGNSSLLSELRGAMPKEDFQKVVGLALQELGQAGEQFSAAKFATEYGKLSDKAKALLFGDPSVKRFVDDIVNVSTRLQSSGRMANSSNTGRAVMMAGGIAGAVDAMYDPIGAASHAATAVGFGLPIVALLSRPATAASMARWSKAYGALVQAPTAGALASFKAASRNFASTIGDQIGLKGQVAQLERAFQNSVPVRADDQKETVPPTVRAQASR